MRKIGLAIGAAAAFVSSPAAAQITLYEHTNVAQQFVTPVSSTFTATSGATTLNFQGYNVPSTLVLVNLFFATTGTTKTVGNNLLDLNYSYTPAGCGAWADEGSVGSYGANDLTFGGSCAGSFDTFSQTLNTSIGSSYTLNFSFTSIGQGANGLRVTAENAITSGVPEPETWAMMLIGFGGIGYSMRRRRRTLPQSQLA